MISIDCTVMDTGTEGTPDVGWRQGKLRQVLVCPERIHRFGGTEAAPVTQVYLKMAVYVMI